MNLEEVLHFLIDLKFNNNRNWLKLNDVRFRNAQKTFELLIDNLIPKLKIFDKNIEDITAKDCIFRIYRDVRFSTNKDPYKSNFGAYIAKGGRKSINAGYYVHIEPDNSFLGGGIYMPEPEVLYKIRTGIFNNTADFKAIVQNDTFKKYFNGFFGEPLKTAPKGFPKDFEDIDLLKFKHYAVGYNVSNEFWTEGNLVEQIKEVFKVQYPFNNFLNNILGNE
ncbi:MAG: DUF2461 domain-containing protein [Bacteroidales bacterium]|nr:DUF2461 domain-containing protein [Bacteroidales bacterium]